MRLGYLLSDIPCKLSTYKSYQECPDRFRDIEPLVSFYETFVDRKEDITFVQYDVLTSDTASNSSTNGSVLSALAHGEIDAYVSPLLVTLKRFEILSFTTPYAFDRICFYMKRPETTPTIHQPFFFLTVFSINTWLLLASTLVVMQLSSYSSTKPFCQNCAFALKLMSWMLVLADGLMCTIYLAGLRELLIETGRFKPPFRNSYADGSR